MEFPRIEAMFHCLHYLSREDLTYLRKFLELVWALLRGVEINLQKLEKVGINRACSRISFITSFQVS